MTNPFVEPDELENNSEILEGFICPICHEDLKSVEFLTEHFKRSHAEEEDALISIFKDFFSIAKKRIGLNSDSSADLTRIPDKNGKSDESSNGGGVHNAKNSRTHINVYNFMEKQDLGRLQCHFSYFRDVRNPRLERYASETNKLIIRLHKLLKNMPTDAIQRKLHEQSIVTWLDGSSVKLCPNCAKNFHLARRQHHCRLCGSIMCQDCSEFLKIDVAKQLASLSTQIDVPSGSDAVIVKTQPQAIRCCSHCLWLLETRQEMHENQTCEPPIKQLYTLIQEERKKVLPNVETYMKIVNSLYSGESMFTLNDASRVRGQLGQIAETIDMYSKQILALPCQEKSRGEALKKAVRLSCIQLIKEKLLSLPPLPAEDKIREIQERKRMETKQRIETEKRMAMEAYKRYGLQGSARDGTHSIENATYVTSSALHTLDNWSAHSSSRGQAVPHNDPLVEQINIIKGYIKQARQDLNFDVVETLELNLRDLQAELDRRERFAESNTLTDKP